VERAVQAPVIRAPVRHRNSEHVTLDAAARPTYLPLALALGRHGCQKRRAEPRSILVGDKEMAFRPLGDRVLVKRVEEESKTKGGIIIPDTAKEKPQEGEVVSVGPGARDEDGKHIAMDLKAGDRILFGKWSGTEVKLEGEDLIIMKESDVLGVLG